MNQVAVQGFARVRDSTHGLCENFPAGMSWERPGASTSVSRAERGLDLGSIPAAITRICWLAA